jgi:hypothetical protein
MILSLTKADSGLDHDLAVHIEISDKIKTSLHFQLFTFTYIYVLIFRIGNKNAIIQQIAHSIEIITDLSEPDRTEKPKVNIELLEISAL